jgi:hypothetical protein
VLLNLACLDEVSVMGAGLYFRDVVLLGVIYTAPRYKCYIFAVLFCLGTRHCLIVQIHCEMVNFTLVIHG